MKTKTIVGLLSCMALVLCLYVTPSATAASAQEEILKVMKDNFKAFNTSNFTLISSLWWHSPKSVLLGPTTDDPFIFQGWEEIEKGSKEGFNVPPGTYKFTMHHTIVTMVKDDVGIISTYLYVIYTNPTTKVPSMIQSRFSPVLQKIEWKWLYINVHVSMMP